MVNSISNSYERSGEAVRFDLQRKLTEDQLRLVVPRIVEQYEMSLKGTTDPNERTRLITEVMSLAHSLGEAGFMPPREELEAEANRIFEGL